MSRLRKRRAVILVAVIAVVGTVAIGATLRALYPSLPPPAKCNQEQLLTWMATRDLTQETKQIRLALVRRLEQELSGDIPTDEIDENLTSQQRDLLASNAELLLKIWFSHAAAEFADVPVSDRPAYVKRRIEQVESWDWEALMELLPSPSDPVNQAGHTGAQLARLNNMIQQWLRASPKASKRQIEEFANAVRAQMMMRMFAWPAKDQA